MTDVVWQMWQRLGRRWRIALVVMPVVALLVYAGSTGESTYGAVEARVDCKMAVRSQLRAPSTVDFVRERATQDRGGDWIVQGTFDAQNAFGARLRHDYRCTASDDGAGSGAVQVEWIGAR